MLKDDPSRTMLDVYVFALLYIILPVKFSLIMFLWGYLFHRFWSLFHTQSKCDIAETMASLDGRPTEPKVV